MSILCTCLKFCRPDVPFQKVVQRSLVTKAFWTPGLRNTCELNPTQSTPGFQLLQPQLWAHLAKSGKKYFRRKYSIFYYRYNFKKSKKRHKEQKFCTFQNLFRELCSPIQWVCKQSPKLKNLMNPFPKRERMEEGPTKMYYYQDETHLLLLLPDPFHTPTESRQLLLHLLAINF